MTSLQWFRMLCPEFASVLDATVNQWLALAASDVYAPCLSADDLARAQALYAAHSLKLSQDAASGITGAVKSEREGDLSRSYGNLSGDSTLLGSTPYGLQYKSLTDRCFGASILTRM